MHHSHLFCGWKGDALSAAAFRELALSNLACWQDEIWFTWGKFGWGRGILVYPILIFLSPSLWRYDIYQVPTRFPSSQTCSCCTKTPNKRHTMYLLHVSTLTLRRFDNLSKSRLNKHETPWCFARPLNNVVLVLLHSASATRSSKTVSPRSFYLYAALTLTVHHIFFRWSSSLFFE